MDPHPQLQPSRVQYIEQVFGEWLGNGGVRHGLLGPQATRDDFVRWIHEELFVKRRQVASIRSDFNQSNRAVRVVAVTSGKGGVGKTTFSVNLAVALARQGRRILLFDADLGLANVHVFAGVNPTATLLDVVDGRARLESVLTPGPGGVQIICGASGIGRLADLSQRVLESLGRELLRIAADFEVLVIDTGAGIGGSVTHFLSLAQDAVVVATPNLASTLDAYGIIKVAHEAKLATRMHLLINQADDEAQAMTVRTRITACAARFLKATPCSLGYLLRDPEFEAASHERRPLLLARPDNPNTLRIIDLAARLVDSAAALARHSSHGSSQPKITEHAAA